MTIRSMCGCRSRRGTRSRTGGRPRARYYMRAVARLRPGVDRRRAEAHASQVYNAVHKAQRMDGSRPSYRIVLGELPPGHEPVRSRQTNVLMAVGGVSVLVLLMACGNVGNLIVLTGLRRSTSWRSRRRWAPRADACCARCSFRRCCSPLVAGGGALAMVLTVGGLVRRVLLPPLAATAAPIDGRLVLLTVGICAAAALVLGLVPAIRLTPRESGTWSGTPRPPPSRLIDAFVAFQVALAVPLLVGTGLFAVSFWKAPHVDFGQETDHVPVVRANFVDDGRPERRSTPLTAESRPTCRRCQAWSRPPWRSRAMDGGYATALRSGSGPATARCPVGQRCRSRSISIRWASSSRDARSARPTIGQVPRGRCRQ